MSLVPLFKPVVMNPKKITPIVRYPRKLSIPIEVWRMTPKINA